MKKFEVSVEGVMAVVNSSLTDRTFGKSSNTLKDLLESTFCFKDLIPYSVVPIPFRQVTAADIAAYGATLTVADLIAVFKMNVTNDKRSILNDRVGVLGWYVTQRFTSNVVSGAYSLLKKSFADDGVLASEFLQYSREIIVTPEGGANSVSEFVILNMQPSISLNFDALANEYNDGTVKRQSYLNIERFQNTRQPSTDVMGYSDSGIIVLKNQFGFAQNTTCLPILAHAEAFETMHTLLESGYGLINDK